MINASTTKYCLIGKDIRHSLSPFIINTLFQRYNMNSVYFTCRVNEDKVEDAIKGVVALDIRGLNITMPYKETVVSFIDKLSRDARNIGAVNTIVNRGGMLKGYNTDWKGIFGTLSEKYKFDKFKRCIILGAGGAAKATVYALTKLCNRIIIINRTLKKAVNTALRFASIFRNIEVRQYNTESVQREIPLGDLIVNATSVGMYTKMSPIPKGVIPKNSVVFDLVYSPLETTLLKYAKEREAVTIDGLWMLIYQALDSFNIWTGIKADPHYLRSAIEGIL